MRKPAFCMCENKDTDQLCSSCTADQCLCFRYSEIQSFYLNPKFRGSSLFLRLYSSVQIRPGRKSRSPVFSCHSYYHLLHNAPIFEKQLTIADRNSRSSVLISSTSMFPASAHSSLNTSSSTPSSYMNLDAIIYNINSFQFSFMSLSRLFHSNQDKPIRR